jgi:hypothetical protein
MKMIVKHVLETYYNERGTLLDVNLIGVFVRDITLDKFVANYIENYKLSNYDIGQKFTDSETFYIYRKNGTLYSKIEILHEIVESDICEFI